MRVRMEHLRKLNYCASGVREFFQAQGLDYLDFLKNGIEPEVLRTYCGEDSMVLSAIEVANGQQQQESYHRL